MYSLPKILWLRDNRPEVFGKTIKFCGVPEYIQARLGLEPITDYTIASRFMAFDINRHEWSDVLLDAAELDPRLLCETGQAGQCGGVIPRAMAAELNLDDGTILAPAGHDQCRRRAVSCLEQGPEGALVSRTSHRLLLPCRGGGRA